MTLLLLGLHTSSLSINFSGPLGLPTRVVTRSHRKGVRLHCVREIWFGLFLFFRRIIFI